MIPADSSPCFVFVVYLKVLGQDALEMNFCGCCSRAGSIPGDAWGILWLLPVFRAGKIVNLGSCILGIFNKCSNWRTLRSQNGVSVAAGMPICRIGAAISGSSAAGLLIRGTSVVCCSDV